MPVQRALEYIWLRRENQSEYFKEAKTLTQLAEIACSEGFQCSAEELEDAFITDWKMRWMKLNAGMNNSLPGNTT